MISAGKQAGCPLEQGAGRAVVAARVRPTPRRREQAAGPERQLASVLVLRSELDRLGLDDVADESMRSFAEQHLPRGRCLLESGGDVHGVAGDERLARAGDDLAAVDADADLEPEAIDRNADLRGRPHRPRSGRQVRRHGT